MDILIIIVLSGYLVSIIYTIFKIYDVLQEINKKIK